MDAAGYARAKSELDAAEAELARMRQAQHHQLG